MEKFARLNSDIPFDAFLRLPTKDLLQCRCVSKPWNLLLSDVSFIQIQSRRKELLSGFFFQERYQFCYEDIKTISYIPVNRKPGAALHQNVFDFLPDDVVVLASCNGLVCCRSCYPFKDPAIFVCNPLNKEWIELDWVEPEKDDVIALAFDPLQDLTEKLTNFKVVRVMEFATEQEEGYFKFDVYSSKTRNWKMSKEICRCNDNLYKSKSVFLGGFLYWLTDGDKILTYNVESELPWLISAPLPARVFTSVPVACIGESEGQLHYVMVSEEGLHIWSLEDYFESNWFLKYSKTLAEMEKENSDFLRNLKERVARRLFVDANPPWIDPLAFKDGVLLMRVANTIYLYHLQTSKMVQVSDNSDFGTKSVFCSTVLPYSMSLVPLTRAFSLPTDRT